jgi:hypothetical protein
MGLSFRPPLCAGTPGVSPKDLLFACAAQPPAYQAIYCTAQKRQAFFATHYDFSGKRLGLRHLPLIFFNFLATPPP